METSSKRMQAVYAIVPKPEGRDVWLRVGSAFPNRDGSLTVLLDAIPTNGRLQIREYQPREGALTHRDDADERPRATAARPSSRQAVSLAAPEPADAPLAAHEPASTDDTRPGPQRDCAPLGVALRAAAPKPERGCAPREVAP